MTFAEALKAVEHREGCPLLPVESVVLDMSTSRHLSGPVTFKVSQVACRCDRDERIAKGIEAACKAAWVEGYSGDEWDDLVAAFLRAASLGSDPLHMKGE